MEMKNLWKDSYPQCQSIELENFCSFFFSQLYRRSDLSGRFQVEVDAAVSLLEVVLTLQKDQILCTS